MKPLVTIAIPDLVGPHMRAATLASLERHTPEPYTTVLLARPNFEAPAALNRLLETCETPYLLLLESGAIVSAGWLKRLLAPLDDPNVGLSGPSTNWCWNEQGLLPHGKGRDGRLSGTTLTPPNSPRFTAMQRVHSTHCTA